MEMFLPYQPKRNAREASIARTNIGGYMIDCHIVVELRMERRPKRRNRTSGEAFISESTTPFLNPAGDIAGASAMNTLTLSFNFGCIDSVAKACAVPCENPMYDSDGW